MSISATWGIATPAVTAAFLASLVEIVEAFTIVLAVAMLRGWRAAGTGTAAAFAVLALIVLIFGPLLGSIPIHLLQFAIGVLLLLFGLGWLRKATLRAGGILPLHDEDAIFRRTTAQLSKELRGTSQDWIGGLAAFKAVLLEGIEVVFIVIAVGAGRDLLWPASLGAFTAFVAVLAVGAFLYRPLARVPENTLKFCVGAMMSAFGVFWTGEGLGIDWPGEDAALILFAGLFLATGLFTATAMKRPAVEAAP